MKSIKGRLGIYAFWLAAAAVTLWCWHIVTTSGGVSPLLLPQPGRVWEELTRILTTGEFVDDLKVTMGEIFTAFFSATIIGITVGFIVSRSKLAVDVIQPVMAGLYSIPIILFIPLFVLIFGIGPASKVAIGMTIGFFPIFFNTVSGFTNVDPVLLRAARSMGATTSQMLFQVLIPASIPSVLNGLRIGFTLALLSVVGSETIASFSGLGHRIVQLAEAMSTAPMFGYIVIVSVLAGALNMAIAVFVAKAGGRS